MKKRELYTIIVFIIIAALDNAALALIPVIIKSLAEGLGIPETLEGVVAFSVAGVTLITAVTSFFWGYYGDKYNRKKLLLYGTIIWATFILLSSFSQTFTQFLIFQLLAGIGLGCIASVGFSIITDFVSPARRGLALSLWGLSQGAGNAFGYTLAMVFDIQIGWNSAFWALSLITFGFVVAYFFTIDPQRGATEEELQDVFKSGSTYDYRISRKDLRRILGIRTNKFLIIQGFFAQIGWGGIQLLPIVLINKVMAQGVLETPAKMIGPLIAGLFQIGGVFSVIFGWLGDKYQKKTLKSRPIISAIGVFLSIPLIIAMLLIPFQLTSAPNSSSIGVILGYLAGQLFSNPLFLITFIVALFAAIFASADAPNFYALVGDVNLPEHRGTLYGFSNFINGLGRSAGLLICAGLQLLLISFFPLDLAWIYALCITLLFVIPAGLCYAFTIRTTPHDLLKVKEILAKRAETELEV
ncbi:MAG: MFS transporter [Candidatus Helarchaeota archaeon]|nr:MFS transporter [Candidatus Helarchaeota archaeon]